MTATSVIDLETKRTRYRYTIILIMMGVVGISYVDRVNISILIANGSFLTEMGIKGQDIQIGLLTSVFLVAYGFANFVLSPLADVIGARKAIAIAILLWMLSTTLSGLANLFAVMLLARVTLGLGEGMQFPVTGLVVRTWFPASERGRANAVWGVGTTLAPAMAMPLFTWITASYGWHSVFWISLALSVVALLLVWNFTVDQPSDCDRVNSLELKHIEGEVGKRSGKVSDTVSEPLIDRLRSFMFDYKYWLLVGWYVSTMIIIWGLLTWLPSYLETGRGFSWEAMGWLSSLPFVLGMCVKIIAGGAIDATHKSGIFCILATIGAGIGIYFSATVADNWVSAILICVAQAFMYIGAPASWTLLQGIVPEKSMSTAGGFMIGTSTFAGAVSPVIIGYLVNMSHSYTGALYFLCAAAVTGSVIMLPLVRR